MDLTSNIGDIAILVGAVKIEKGRYGRKVSEWRLLSYLFEDNSPRKAI